jgi:hypothetical protein
MMKSTVTAAALLFAFVTSALAIDAPPIPSGAKKLSGKEAAAIYLGKTLTFENYTQDQPMTGEVTVSPKGKLTGSWALGTSKKGAIKGAARNKADTWCFKMAGSKEECMAIYVDGTDIYEVNAKGVVTSKLSLK